MERDSLRYKIRRKIQAFAGNIAPHELLCSIYSRIVIKKRVNIRQPKTFNEKIQWCKLYFYPKNPLIVQCTDKYTARDYVSGKGLSNILVPLLGAWENSSEIVWSSLPDHFVLKCSHGCAYNILCTDKCHFDHRAASKQLDQWLKEDFGAFNLELHYSQIKKPMIICEPFLGECITDYKFFCFNGHPECLYVSTDLIHDRKAKIGFFHLDGKKMPMKRDDYEDIDRIELPEFYSEMRATAQLLCQDFPFVRVDFFVTANRYYFSELTFTPGAGMMPFNPDVYDEKWGEMLHLEREMELYGK